MLGTAPRILLEGHEFALCGAAAAVGVTIPGLPGTGDRVLLTAPSFEHFDPDPAARFAAVEAEMMLIALSVDHRPVRAAWTARAGWRSGDIDRDAAERLGVWVPALSLLAPGLFVVDRRHRLVHGEITGDLAEAPDFEAALAALKGRR